MPFIKNIILHLFNVLLQLASYGDGEEELQEESMCRFADLPEYNLEQVQVLADLGDLILGRPV